MSDYCSLGSLALTNQCVVICDLRDFDGADACAAWRTLRGSQSTVGGALAHLLGARHVRRLDDFGGVCATLLCEGRTYLETPPRIIGPAAVFSFTPKKRVNSEGLEMARAARAAGYEFLLLTLQKQGKFGKVWVLCGLLEHFAEPPLTYFEDTGEVVDELKQSAPSGSVLAVHVQAPGYEEYPSRLADRVVTQSQYRNEVLAKCDGAT